MRFQAIRKQPLAWSGNNGCSFAKRRNQLGENAMKRVFKGIRKFVGDERGLETVEYAVVAALITVAAVTAITLVGTNVANKFSAVANVVK